jgi:hypothetical protein
LTSAEPWSDGAGFARPALALRPVALQVNVLFTSWVAAPLRTAVVVSFTNTTGIDLLGDITATFSARGVRFLSLGTSARVKASGINRDGQFFVTIRGGLKKNQSVVLNLQVSYASSLTPAAVRKLLHPAFSIAD